MAMFLAEISFLLALALFAAGLVLWHRGREANAGLLRAAGAVLAVGAVLTALCMGYFSVRYHVQGEFDHAYPYPHHAAIAAHEMMGSACAHHAARGMGPGMMGPGTQGMLMRPDGPPAEGTAPSETPPGHGEHHPDGDE